MIRYLIIAVLFLLIIRVVTDLARPRKGDPPPAEESVLVPDAQTGVYFEKSKAVTVVTGGRTYYFSSRENRDLWLRRNLE
ncbi:MAG: hypothetical protein LBR53_02050 [Deltaproteobacteria bacterium]|jgi:lysylphosphatidylglycerol synthetase-like protein (DUF2156 family)|nr:hypothetical protein [Deltaproteobacteria bacterium]